MTSPPSILIASRQVLGCAVLLISGQHLDLSAQLLKLLATEIQSEGRLGFKFLDLMLQEDPELQFIPKPLHDLCIHTGVP